MISNTNPRDCCGCTACENICPHSAISMKPDALGFLYPIIDADKCTGCNLCDKVCAFNNQYKKNDFEHTEVYAVRHKDIGQMNMYINYYKNEVNLEC